jgi:lipopolysaccharide transport protein LptA
MRVFDSYGTLLIPSSKKIKKEDEVEESFFKNVQYFLLEKRLPFLSFESDLLTHSQSDAKLLGINPRGHVFREKDSEPIHFTAKNIKVFLNSKEINLENDILVNVDNTDLHSDQMKILLNENMLSASGHVKTFSNSKSGSEQILIDSNSLVYRPKLKYFEYRDDVKGTLKRTKKYEESIRFSTDSLNFDGLSSLAELKGNVHLLRDNFNILANFGNIYLENYNKKLKYYAFSDDVKLEEKVNSEGRSFTRKAFAEKLEGFMSEKKIVLTGLPKVFQDKDVIKGNMIIIRENVETVEVDDANTNITIKED